MNTLRPCPFCHAQQDKNPLEVKSMDREGENGKHFWVHCGCCGADGPHKKSEGGATQVWNQRFTDAGVRTTSVVTKTGLNPFDRWAVMLGKLAIEFDYEPNSTTVVMKKPAHTGIRVLKSIARHMENEGYQVTIE